MIRLADVRLPAEVQQQLDSWQAEVDGEADYAARVAAGKRLFKARNVERNATFRQVRHKLAEMCAGAQRCCYCEDSAADEVEHIRPKDLYPEDVFRWPNYLYACGPCNGPKGSEHFVFPAGSAEAVNVSRPRNAPIVPPVAGDDVLINPRREHGPDFLELDLAGTFRFLIRRGLSPRDQQRGEITCQVLRLNVRDVLVKARRAAYQDYLAHAEVYVAKKRAGAAPAELLRRRVNLTGRSHPTVWEEMKRQRHKIPRLTVLFNEAPELLEA